MNEFHSYRRAERAGIARWFFVATFLVLVVAFFRTQVVQHERFRVRAEKNRLRIVPLVAPRGIIYDRNGLIIAENVPGYAIKLLAPSQDSLHAVRARCRDVVPPDTSEASAAPRAWPSSSVLCGLTLTNTISTDAHCGP